LPVFAQSRIKLPVFGAIWGFTNTMCTKPTVPLREHLRNERRGARA
jgi:hypothetical protein